MNVCIEICLVVEVSSHSATTDLQMSNTCHGNISKVPELSQDTNVHDDDCELLVSWASAMDLLRESKQLT